MPLLNRLRALPLLSTPHRLYFVAGLCQLLLALVYWALELAARLLGAGGLDLGLPPRWVHGLLMVHGTMPFFVFGFLMTAMPRWHGAGAIVPAQFQRPAGAMAAGWVLVWAGLTFAGAAPVGLGLLLAAAGVLWGVRALLPIARAPMPATAHARLACVALVAGALGQGATAVGVLRLDAAWVQAGLQAGLWLSLAPIFLVVAHRMLPVFTRGGLGLPVPETARWLLWVVPATCWLHGLLAIAGAPQWTWLVDLPAAAAGLVWCWRGGLRASLSVRLLAMHHLALLWFPLAMALFAAQSLADLAGVVWGGLAPLHALSIGFFLSMVLGMATRVTRGHSGRPVEATGVVWGLFWCLQAAAVLRGFADLLPVGLIAPVLLMALVAALVPFLGWARGHLAMLLR